MLQVFARGIEPATQDPLDEEIPVQSRGPHEESPNPSLGAGISDKSSQYLISSS